MKVDSYSEKDFLIIKSEGRLDIATATEFEKKCTALLEQGHLKLVLDFSALEYISSAGLRSILAVAKKLKSRGGTISLCCLTGLVQEVFALSGFDTILPVYASVAEALAGGEK